MKMRAILLTTAILVCATSALADSGAGWLIDQARGGGMPGPEFAGADDLFRSEQSDFGGEATAGSFGGGGTSGAIPLIMSLILPGAGEAYMGYWKRGVPMAAIDIYGWTRQAHYNSVGDDYVDEYFAYADAHWSLDRLDGAFNDLYWDEELAGVGKDYYPGVDNHEELSLWVSAEDDVREYYENLGKWNQFVFGWDDFENPADGNLSDPAVSAHRQVYRGMRDASNDAYQKADRWLYVNILLRVASAAQVAWLQGWFGGGYEVAGHDIELDARPQGSRGASLGLNISW